MLNFIWFSPCTVCLKISSQIVWNFLFFTKLKKRGVLFVTFFVLDWSQPLGYVSAFFIFVAWRLGFIFFLLEQHLICADHCNVSATHVRFNSSVGELGGIGTKSWLIFLDNFLQREVLSWPELRSRRVLGGVGFLTTLGVGVGIFCPTPDVQLDHFSHHTPKFGIPVEMVQFLSKLLLKQTFLAVYHDFHWF